ncbi:MAG TPA: PAS domain-containing protein [Spirochaetota bacterium]|nr:PAS domain-containing protein [Spirochaetota bacterium]
MINERKQLLLVEDEILIAAVEMKSLEKAGFSVISACSGEGAIETVRKRDDIDLILMDINLGPGIDGVEAATVILKEKDIPLVFLSSHTEPEVVDKTESITSYGYVVKNSGITVLTASIKMAFRLYEARRQIERQSREVEEANRRLQELLEELEETNRELVLSRHEIIENRAEVVKSNEKFMLIADSMPQIVWTAEPGGGMDFLNEVYYRYTGDDRYAGGIKFRNVHPDDIENVDNAWKDSVSTGKELEVRHRIKRYDGNYRWFLSRGIPVYNNEGNLIKWYGTCTDIEDIVLLKEERLRLEHNLLEAQRLSCTGSYEYDMEDEAYYCSDEVFNIVGISREKLKRGAYDFFRFVHPEDLSRVKDIIMRAMAEKTCVSFEHRIIRDDSTVRYLRQRFETIFDANEKPARLIGIVQDITGPAIIKEALRESEERWQFALEEAGDGLWDWNILTGEVYFSKRLKELLGYSEDDLENRLESVLNLVHPEDKENVVAEMKKYFKGEIPIYATEHRLKCRDGSYKWILNRGKIIKKNSDSKPQRVIGIFTDVTESRTIKNSLVSALAEKETYMRELQHRVKNSLAMITSLISLELGQSENPDVRRSLKTIEGRVMVLNKLYQLLYSGEGSSELPLDIYLKTIIGSITEGYGDSAGKVSVITELDNIDIDPKRATSIGIILNELLTNSIKYAFTGRDSGTVNVALQLDDNSIKLKVSDDGEGLPENFNSELSAGLGLKLINLLTIQMKGEFRINSSGTPYFEVALPVIN